MSRSPRDRDHPVPEGPDVPKEEVDGALRRGEIASWLDPREEQEIRNLAAERDLRKLYAIVWLLIVGTQLLVLYTLVVLVGRGFLDLDRWIFTGLLAGTFAQVISVVLVITKNLFPSPAVSAGTASP